MLLVVLGFHLTIALRRTIMQATLEAEVRRARLDLDALMSGPKREVIVVRCISATSFAPFR